MTPNVSGRLPIETVNRLRANAAGAQAAIPVVASLTVDVAGGTHGFFLLAGSCQIELLFRSFNCDQRVRDDQPAAVYPVIHARRLETAYVLRTS